MNKEITASEVYDYSRYSRDSIWEKLWNLFIVISVFFYLPFLAVWYVFLRYVVTAYGSALANGYPLTEAWSRFFSSNPRRILYPEAAEFMAKADAIVTFPVSLPGRLMEATIGLEVVGNAIGLILIVSFFSLLFIVIPYKLFSFFQSFIRGKCDR